MLNRIIISLILVVGFCKLQAQEQKFQLSSHILDISRGQVASNVKVQLERQKADGGWEMIAENKTDAEGRIKNFLPYNEKQSKGIYKLIYYTQPYFESLNLKSFYPFIEVVFEINDGAHYHVPITLSPFGYSTYRGS